MSEIKLFLFQFYSFLLMIQSYFLSGKTLIPPSSDSWTPTSLGNADLSLYRCEIFLYLNLSELSWIWSYLISASTYSSEVGRKNNGLSLNSDSTPEKEISFLESTSDSNQVMTVDPDTHTIDGIPSLLSSPSKKELASPQGKSAYPSVSITPVTSLPTMNSHAITYPNIHLERRPGIEIIPFNKDASSSIPSSLTITPIGGKPPKDKTKYKEVRLKESLNKVDTETKERDRDKERERKERKRRREGEKSPSSGGGGSGIGGKPTKMMCLSATLMGPPGALLKMDSSPKLGHKSSNTGNLTGSTTPSATSLSPLTSPSKSGSKSSTPSSSPKHPSSGGKPSMSALSMSALKCESIFLHSNEQWSLFIHAHLNYSRFIFDYRLSIAVF